MYFIMTLKCHNVKNITTMYVSSVKLYISYFNWKKIEILDILNERYQYYYIVMTMKKKYWKSTQLIL